MVCLGTGLVICKCKKRAEQWGQGMYVCVSLRKEKRRLPYRNKSHQGEKGTGKDLRDIGKHLLKYFL